jgi:hypothetical protein
VYYRSGFEAGVAHDLHRREIGFEYEAHKFLYEIPAIYVVDFSIGDMHIEAKGYFSPADRRKLLEVKRAHPDLDLRLLFQRANTRLSKARRSMTYGQWATRHGFPWAEGTVPDHWLKGK